MRRILPMLIAVTLAAGMIRNEACAQKNGRKSFLGKKPPEIVSEQNHWLVHSRKLTLAKLKGQLVWLQFNY